MAELGKERTAPRRNRVNPRVVRVKNTLRIAEVDVSESLLPEVATRDDLTQVGDPAPLAFDAAGALLPF